MPRLLCIHESWVWRNNFNKFRMSNPIAPATPQERYGKLAFEENEILKKSGHFLIEHDIQRAGSVLWFMTSKSLENSSLISRYHSLENYLAKMRLVYLKATKNDAFHSLNPLDFGEKRSYIEDVTEKFYAKTKSNRVMANSVLPGLMVTNGTLCTVALGFGFLSWIDFLYFIWWKNDFMF